MQASPPHTQVSGTEAATRLRYLSEVQQRTRRAALSPAFGLLFVGAIAVTHGLVVTVWPHSRVEWLVWLGALVAVRPLMRWLRRRLEQRRGFESGWHARLACAAAALAFLVLAFGTGANPLVSALIAATALMAYLASMPLVSLAAIGVGLVGDFAIRQGLPVGTGQLLVGAALVAIGIATSVWEEKSHGASH
jgi:hypothetical protein